MHVLLRLRCICSTIIRHELFSENLFDSSSYWLLFIRIQYACRTATKLAIGAGAVYLTVDQGVWSSQSESSQALSKVRTKVLPETNEYWQKVGFCFAI